LHRRRPHGRRRPDPRVPERQPLPLRCLRRHRRRRPAGRRDHQTGGLMRPFAYVAPGSLADAVDALRDAAPGTKVLAGGTTLYDLMKLGIETPPVVVDVHRLPELNTIETRDHELVFGAGARMADVAD